MGNHIYFAIPIMALLGIVESSVLSRFPVAGAVPQFMFLVALTWGMERGLEEGLVWAFIAGFFTDLFSLAPMGISALAFMAGVAGPLLLRRALPPRRLLVAMLMAALGTLIYITIYALGLRPFGFGISFGGLMELWPLIVLHTILIVPVYLATSALLRVSKPRRVEF